MWPFGLEFACQFSGSSVELSLHTDGDWPVLLHTHLHPGTGPGTWGG